MARSRHFVLALAGPPGCAAALALVALPVLGMALAGDFGERMWREAVPYLLLAAALGLPCRGVTVVALGEAVRVWYGLALTRWLVLRLWLRPAPADRWAAVRVFAHAEHRHGTGLPVRSYVVTLESLSRDRRLTINRAVTHGGAVRKAQRIAEALRLPLHGA